jgi:CheY-like chemotaxis protein
MKEERPLLIVEDSDEDFEVTCWALRQAGFDRPIVRCSRAEEALLRLCPVPPNQESGSMMPCLVLLDLNLPGMNGLQLLEELRSVEQPPTIPVVILSTSKNPRDLAACYRLGAAGYLCKPLSLELYTSKMLKLTQYWFDAVTLPEE